MNEDSPREPSADGKGPYDIVGSRVLVGVQVVDISRLSTHPVPLISEGLIAVSGQGPKDSNGAGKSSFIAALSLLHADDQWRLASGAASAAELLFTAELAAQEARWSNANRGYVIGVFTSPTATTATELNSSALTVWLRVNRKSPYLDLRWTNGLHLAYGASEDERARRVDALWDALPRSNGRTDFHASRMSTVLYGEHARCVSFLSTSVRASPTANLLAQPLNDLSPERIFDAIATLTGLNPELEHERALRTVEHARGNDAKEAERDLEAWDREAARTEEGIIQRGRARERLGMAREAWHGRCARHLLDGVDRADEIRAELGTLDGEAARIGDTISELSEQLRQLADDAEFATRFQKRELRHKDLEGRDRALERELDRTSQHIETLTSKLQDLLRQAQTADGRSLDQAQAEVRDADEVWQAAIGAKAVAEQAVTQAHDQLAAAESGEDVSADQLHHLQRIGVPTAALLDVVHLDETQREAWEPRLAPYRTALVIHPDNADEASTALRELPSSMLVLADPPGVATTADGLPATADPRFSVSTFLRSLADRSGPAPRQIDTAAGVVVVGSFPEPLTGRAARITAARAAVRTSSVRLGKAEGQVNEAKRHLDRASSRVEGAQAAIDADSTQKTIERLRGENTQREQQREQLQPDLAAATRDFDEVKGERAVRKQQIEAVQRQIGQLETERTAVGAKKARLTDERNGIDLADRQASWGETHEAATQYLLSLTDSEQRRTVGDWNEEACHLLNDAARLCFPEDTPTDYMPAEVRELLIEQRWHRAGLETRVRLAPALLRALDIHLALTERQDRYEQHQITQERERRTKDLAAARQGLNEATHASQVHRSSLAAGIKATLKKVAAEFDRLDKTYGGYGAGLEFPEPEPPTQPDKPWRWAVTPKWRRAEGQRLTPYNLRANTAQIDEKAVKLVCAAALSGTGERPLLLVLDELGRNLGSEHRREAVALFERIGADRNITVVGALQDDMERYAINASGLYIKLRRSSDAMPYNEAPVVSGSENNAARVDLLHDWLLAYRPSHAPNGGGGEA